MPRKDDTTWLSEGLEEHEVSRNGKSGSSVMSKLTSPLRRLSNTVRRSSRPGSFDGGGGAAAAMSKTGGNPFAGAAVLRKQMTTCLDVKLFFLWNFVGLSHCMCGVSQ